MLLNESIWIGKIIPELELKEKAEFLNFGSQSLSYNKDSRFIFDNVIYPIKEKYIIKNLDIKNGPGIDIHGDILDDDFFNTLKNRKFDCILLCNVLEHVNNYQELAARISQLVKDGGYIIFTGPYDYPRHFDPIDNDFRPTVDEVKALFPNFIIKKGEIIEDFTLSFYFLNSIKYALWMFFRVLAPFYKFYKWKHVVLPRFKYWNKKFKVTCILFEKKEI